MKISGFFTVDDVAAFAATVAAEIAVLKRQAGAAPHVTLCDTRGVQIQSQDAVAAFTAMLDNPAARSRRLAYVVDAALARMQIRRLTERSDAGYFDTVEAAEAAPQDRPVRAGDAQKMARDRAAHGVGAAMIRR
jgi:hypothetical protein